MAQLKRKNSAAFYDVDGTLIRINIVHAFAFYASFVVVRLRTGECQDNKSNSEQAEHERNMSQLAFNGMRVAKTFDGRYGPG